MDPQIPRLARDMWKRFGIAFLLVVGLSAAATATAALLQVKDIADALNKGTHLNLGRDTLTRADVGAPQTLMLLGSDHRSIYGKGVRGNSDTMMLIRLDPDKAATSIMSIPRDLRVPIYYRGTVRTAKINAAYNMGGPGLSARTVQRVLEEILVDFWFNNFNVFAGKIDDKPIALEYERDVIRPHVLGRFRDLLGAVATSPAKPSAPTVMDLSSFGCGIFSAIFGSASRTLAWSPRGVRSFLSLCRAASSSSSRGSRSSRRVIAVTQRARSGR